MAAIVVITLFPSLFTPFCEQGVTGRAIKSGKLWLECISPRQFAFDRHQTVDARPYGGGPGMVMMVEPLRLALQAAVARLAEQGFTQPRVIYLSPQGRRFNQQVAKALGTAQGLVFIAGRYEGVDERFIRRYVHEEWSIGDYVLSGGELPAMVMIDAMARFLPGVLGDADSALQDSFEQGLLDCPHYTRPECYLGDGVPEVLLSGNHKRIATWRLQQSLGRTWERRPDLLENRLLTDEQVSLLQDYQASFDD